MASAVACVRSARGAYGIDADLAELVGLTAALFLQIAEFEIHCSFRSFHVWAREAHGSTKIAG